ncbi:MAG: VWA domain-containing protein [Lachnospiraceae bacterium]|nr:VWA domain-containing protein [Lachnospiraceae bacterium]
MKKRVVAALLAAMMAMASMVACGKTEEQPDQKIDITINDPGQVDPDEKTPGVAESIAEKYREFLGNPYDDMVMESACVEAAECDDGGYVTNDLSSLPYVEYNTEKYSALEESGFLSASLNPLSTFAADVDTASYSNFRRFVNSGYSLKDIPTGAIRTEEMVNYFNYDYNLPQKDEPFGLTTTISACPWNPDHALLVLGLKTADIDLQDAPNSNIVFLIDTSGSMYSEDKLPLLIDSFKLLLDELDENDKVSIVTYAGDDEIVLEGVPASEKDTICAALDNLEAGGSTNGGEGIISAYLLGEQNFIKGGNNRIILATDGDLNVGLTSESALVDLVEEERESGIFLTVLGFGTGNYNDTNMEALADHGNGNYAYIDTLAEAKKVLCEELGGTLYTVAKDVKFQAEFNPAIVDSYRLIGFENRELAAEDFVDDTKDAGEIGAGHDVTMVYEIVLNDGNYSGADLKYQTAGLTDAALESGEWLTLKVRYKAPDGDTSKELSYPIGQESYTDAPSDDFKFVAAVCELSGILHESNYVPTTLSDVKARLETMDYNQMDAYRLELVTLVDKLLIWE